MSAKDAPGEVNRQNIFDSPNISSAEDEIQDEEDKKAEEQKKKETVDIDGIPIDEKDIKYKAADIKKKKKINYFVNVEGAEERERIAKEEAEERERLAEKKAEEAKKAAERAEHKKQLDTDKKIAEEQKKYEAITAFIKKQKAAKARADKKDGERHSGRRGLFVVAGIFVAIIFVVVVIFVIIPAVQRRGNDTTDDDKYFAEYYSNPYNAAIRDLNDNKKLSESLENYYYPEVDAIYEEASKKLSDECDLAKLYMDKANRIYDHDNSETAEVEKALEFSAVFLCEDIDILTNLKGYFELIDNASRAEEIQQKIDAIAPGMTPAEDTSKIPDYDKSEDA